MASQPQDADFTNALLSALEIEAEPTIRVQGGVGTRPAYVLRELPLPPVSEPVDAPERREARRQEQAPASISSAAPAPEPDTVTCPKCGATNVASAKHCTACGYALATVEQPEPAPPPARLPATRKVALISIHEDGSDGKQLLIDHAETVIGRAGDIRFPTDSFLSPKHVRITMEGEKIFVEDLYSLNGTYVKLREEQRLTPGDTFLMGRQVLRFERFETEITPKARASDGTRYMGSPPPGGRFKLLQIGIAGVVQNVYCMPETGAVIGREKGDVIFVRDKFMSARHAQIFPREDGHYYLADLKSSNGTWLKIWERKQIASGDFVFLGQQLFRVQID